MDRRVEEAVVRLRGLPAGEPHRVATGPYEAQAVLLLATPPLVDEAKMVASVAHMKTETMLLTLTGEAEERAKEAKDRLNTFGWVTPCGRLCVLVNQGPCRCVVPKAVAELRRRQRALLWSVEAIMRPARVRTGPTKETLLLACRSALADAADHDKDLETSPDDRRHLRQLADDLDKRASSL